MNPRLVMLLKLLVMVAILGLVGWKLYEAWHTVEGATLHLNWAFGGLSILSFAGSMLTSALTWRWLAWRMGDRTPTLPLLGAYTFSQMGKYVPGKVVLLLMRIERTRRLGMDVQVCVVSTLVENAMYMVSGGLVAVVTLLVFLRNQPAYAWMVVGGMLAMLAVFHPRVFYGLINMGLRKLKRAEVPQEKRLGKTELVTAVFMFLPCWLFGGLSLWCATRTVTAFDLAHLAPMPGAYAFGVTGGMASLLPGGLGTNEGTKMLFLLPLLGNSVKAALAAVGAQRLAQVTVELLFGLAGAMLTGVKAAPPVVARDSARSEQTGADRFR